MKDQTAYEQQLIRKLDVVKKDLEVRKAEKGGDKTLEKKLDEIGSRDKSELKETKYKIEELNFNLSLKKDKIGDLECEIR